MFLILILLSACGYDRNEVKQFVGSTMGTTYTIKALQIPEGIAVDDLKAQVDRILVRINRQMSTYDPESELSRFNHRESTQWIGVSRELAWVIEKALQVSRLSDGFFDVTVGPLVNLWGFGPQMTADDVPSEDAIHEALARVGFQRLHVRDNPPALKKDRADIYVDLSAIAKGYAVDRVAEYLESKGISNYLVEIGGELRAKGHNPSGSPWAIAIEKPTPEQRTIERIMHITDEGIATSGDYRNFFEKEGRRYSHAIDPHTGRPIRHALASVTVVNESCLWADAMATTLLVLGPEKGLELARAQKLAAFFIVITKEGLREQYTPEFTAYLTD